MDADRTTKNREKKLLRTKWEHRPTVTCLIYARLGKARIPNVQNSNYRNGRRLRCRRRREAVHL